MIHHNLIWDLAVERGRICGKKENSHLRFGFNGRGRPKDVE